MEKRKPYDSSKGKIRSNWEDISKLIALEEELMRRIEDLENKIANLSKIVTDKTEG